MIDEESKIRREETIVQNKDCPLFFETANWMACLEMSG